MTITAEEARTSSKLHRVSIIDKAIFEGCSNGNTVTTVELKLTHKERNRLNGLGFTVTPNQARRETTLIDWEDSKDGILSFVDITNKGE